MKEGSEDKKEKRRNNEKMQKGKRNGEQTG
jgi:hypothetical protein